MATTHLSKGTILKVKVGAGALTKVNGLKDFSGLGSGSAAVMDVTDLDSTGHEKRMGLPDEGQLKFSFNWIKDDAGQLLLENARTSQDVVTFEVTLTDAGVKYTQQGFVLTFEKNVGVDKVIELGINVEATGLATRATVS